MSAEIRRLLTARSAGAKSFIGEAGGSEEPRTYGGLLAAQTLSAAAATAGDRPCNALHLLFIDAGDGAKRVEYRVDRLRDGRSYSSRLVTANQDGRTLLTAIASFHKSEEGPSNQMAMPRAPAPESLEDQREIRRRNGEQAGRAVRRSLAEELIDARPCEAPHGWNKPGESTRMLWFRARTRLPVQPALHQSTLAFASDMGLVHLGIAAHNAAGGGEKLQVGSLDHVIWFHRACKADEWLLHVQHSPLGYGGRAITHGSIFDRAGRMVASTAQELFARRKLS